MEHLLRKRKVHTNGLLTFYLKLRVGIILSVAVLAFGNHGLAQETTAKNGNTISGTALETFFDANLPGEMERRHAPGAAAVIVKDGQIIFEKGYGISDLENEIAVDADKTVFRVASVSKIVTTFAAMELVDQGKLDLHGDINQYLKLFQIPPTFAKPVTLANLLTHTGGFDERQIGFTARTRAEQTPLGFYLAKRMPPRVMPPGEIYNYSNHGFALAGYLLESVTNEPFEEYVQNRVFQPLGMNRSSFNFRPDLLPYLATGYSWGRGGYRANALDFPNISPAVSLITTATDMGHFMATILGQGRYGTQQVLSPAVTAMMIKQQFTHDPRISGVAFGFYEAWHGTERLLVQNGEWFGVASLLVLIPGRNTGFFLAVNSEEQGIPFAILQKFLKEYFPQPPRPQVAMPSDPNLLEVSRFSGNYVMNHYSRKSIEKLAELLRPAKVKAAGLGRIEVETLDSGKIDCVATDALLFRAKSSERQVAFRAGVGNRVDYLFVGHLAYRRLHWYEYPRLQLAIFAGFGLVFGLTGLGWPLAPFWFAGRKNEAGLTTVAGRAQFWGRVVARLNVIFLGGMAVCFYFREDLGYYFRIPKIMLGLLWIPPITTAIAPLIVCLACEMWRRKEGTRAARINYSVFVLFTVLFIPFLIYWNLWGFHY